MRKQTLVLASGAAVGLLETGPSAPLVLSAVNNTVGRWATAERFYERAAAGQTMWGGLTAGAWQYIGRQGVLQGTYELFGTIARRSFDARKDVHAPRLCAPDHLADVSRVQAARGHDGHVDGPVLADLSRIRDCG